MPCRGPATPGSKLPGLGIERVRSPLLAPSLLFSFPAGTEMFHFPASRFDGLFIHPPMTVSSTDGLLHSEILGSKRVCRSPGLIAAYRVLRRLAMPRHPPCALSRLCVSSNPPPRAPSRERAVTRGFASKPRARFDCLEIELLMSSHSNFSRLPLSKIAEIDPRNRFFLVAWSHRLTIRPFDHRTEVGGRDWS